MLVITYWFEGDKINDRWEAQIKTILRERLWMSVGKMSFMNRIHVFGKSKEERQQYSHAIGWEVIKVHSFAFQIVIVRIIFLSLSFAPSRAINLGWFKNATMNFMCCVWMECGDLKNQRKKKNLERTCKYDGVSSLTTTNITSGMRKSAIFFAKVSSITIRNGRNFNVFNLDV